jgi:hypothetical protein
LLGLLGHQKVAQKVIICPISRLYYKHVMIVNDDSSIVSN